MVEEVKPAPEAGTVTPPVSPFEVERDHQDDAPPISLREPIEEAGETTQDIAPEPERGVTPPSPVHRRSGFVAPLLGGALVGIIGFGLSHYNVLNLRSDLDSTTVNARFAALEQDLQAAQDNAARAGQEAMTRADAALSAAQAAGGQGADPAELAAMNGKIAALQASLAELGKLGADGAVPVAALAALQSEVAALQASQQATDPKALRQLVEDELKGKADATMAAAEAEAAQVKATAAAEAARLALREALFAGRSYAAELAAAGVTEPPAALASYAEVGLPTLSALEASYPDAARAAIEASLRAAAGQSLTDRAWSLLRIGTGARSLTPQEGTDPDAVQSRAEAALKAGDLAKSVQELQSLPPEGLALMRDWVAQAQARIDAEAALAALTR